MFKKAVAATLIAATAGLAATPALADGYYRRGQPDRRVVVVERHAPHAPAYRRVYVQRPVVVQRPVYVRPAPVVQPVVVQHRGADVFGGLILGAMLGAVIASNAVR
jgi:hypothetical protein